MRLSAPELSARYREGLLAEGAHVIDAGQVGSEMLYFLVGSRELDGGLMCTASHNPKAYTGASSCARERSRCPGDAGIQDVRRTIENGLQPGRARPLAPKPRAGHARGGRHLRGVPGGGAARSSTPTPCARPSATTR